MSESDYPPPTWCSAGSLTRASRTAAAGASESSGRLLAAIPGDLGSHSSVRGCRWGCPAPGVVAVVAVLVTGASAQVVMVRLGRCYGPQVLLRARAAKLGCLGA